LSTTYNNISLEPIIDAVNRGIFIRTNNEELKELMKDYFFFSVVFVVEEHLGTISKFNKKILRGARNFANFLLARNADRFLTIFDGLTINGEENFTVNLLPPLLEKINNNLEAKLSRDED